MYGFNAADEINEIEDDLRSVTKKYKKAMEVLKKALDVIKLSPQVYLDVIEVNKIVMEYEKLKNGK